MVRHTSGGPSFRIWRVKRAPKKRPVLRVPIPLNSAGGPGKETGQGNLWASSDARALCDQYRFLYLRAAQGGRGKISKSNGSTERENRTEREGLFRQVQLRAKRDTFYDFQDEASNNLASGSVPIHGRVPLPAGTGLLKLTIASPSTPVHRFGNDFVLKRRLY